MQILQELPSHYYWMKLTEPENLKKDSIVLFAAVGSGWTYGASIIKWS